MSVLRPTVTLKSTNRFKAFDSDEEDASQGVGHPFKAQGNARGAQKASSKKQSGGPQTPSNRGVRFADVIEGPSKPAESSTTLKSILINKDEDVLVTENNTNDRAAADVSCGLEALSIEVETKEIDKETSTTLAQERQAPKQTETQHQAQASLMGLPDVSKAAKILLAQGHSLEEVETAHILMIAGGWVHDESLGLDFDTALALAMMDYFRSQKDAEEREALEAVRRSEAEEAVRQAEANKKARKAAVVSKQPKEVAPKKENVKPKDDAVNEGRGVPKIAKGDVNQSATATVSTAQETNNSLPKLAVSEKKGNASSTQPELALKERDDGAAEATPESEQMKEAAKQAVSEERNVDQINTSEEKVNITDSEKPLSASDVNSGEISSFDSHNLHVNAAFETQQTEVLLSPQQDPNVITNVAPVLPIDEAQLSLDLEQSGSTLEAIASMWSPEINEDHRLMITRWSERLASLEIEAAIGRAKLMRAPAAIMDALVLETRSKTQQCPHSLSAQQMSQLDSLRLSLNAVTRYMNALKGLTASRTLDILVIRLLGGAVSRCALMKRQIQEIERNVVKADGSQVLALANLKDQHTQLKHTVSNVLPSLIELHSRSLTPSNGVNKTSYYSELLSGLATDDVPILDLDMNSKGGLFVASLSNLLSTSRTTLASMRQVEDQLATIASGLPIDLFPVLSSAFATLQGRDTNASTFMLDDIAVDLVSNRLIEASRQSSALAEAVSRAQSTREALACSKELATFVGASRFIQKQAHDMQFALHHTERDLLEDAAIISERAASLSNLEESFLSSRNASFETFQRLIEEQKSVGDAICDRRESLARRKKELERELAAINQELTGLEVPLKSVNEITKLHVTGYLKVARGIAGRLGVTDPNEEPNDQEVEAVANAALNGSTEAVRNVVDDVILSSVRNQSKSLELRKTCHSKLEGALLTAYNFLKSRVSFDSVSVHTLASSSQVPVAPSTRGVGTNLSFKQSFADAFESHLRAAGDIAHILMQRIQTCEIMANQQKALKGAEKPLSGVLPAGLEEQHNATLRHLEECIVQDQTELASLSKAVRDWVSKTSRATALDHELVVLLTRALARVLNKGMGPDSSVPPASAHRSYPFNLDAEYDVLVRFVNTLREKSSKQSSSADSNVLTAGSPSGTNDPESQVENDINAGQPRRQNRGPRQNRDQSGNANHTPADRTSSQSTISSQNGDGNARSYRERGRGPLNQTWGSSRGGQSRGSRGRGSNTN